MPVILGVGQHRLIIGNATLATHNNFGFWHTCEWKFSLTSQCSCFSDENVLITYECHNWKSSRMRLNAIMFIYFPSKVGKKHKVTTAVIIDTQFMQVRNLIIHSTSVIVWPDLLHREPLIWKPFHLNYRAFEGNINTMGSRNCQVLLLEYSVLLYTVHTEKGPCQNY